MKRTTLLAWTCLLAVTMQAQENKSYQPFIAGQAWITGFDPANDYMRKFEYRFYNDSIIGGRICKQLGKSELNMLSGGCYSPMDTVYVGALYEEEGKVYCILPGSQTFQLLYDFTSPVGTDINLDGNQFTIVRKEKSTATEFKGNCTYLQSKDNEENCICWFEGVGGCGNPLDNLASMFPTGLMNEILISCSSCGESIYLLGEGLLTNSYVKKQWLDFTHTTKPRPRSPQQRAPIAEGEEGNLTGLYSSRELFLNLKMLVGAYTISLANAAGQVIYRREVQTNNIVAVNTDLTIYDAGEYTLTVENSKELYTARLVLPLADTEEVAVRDLPSSFNSKSSTLNWTTLSGQHLHSTPTRPGLYIVGEKKVYVKR